MFPMPVFYFFCFPFGTTKHLRIGTFICTTARNAYIREIAKRRYTCSHGVENRYILKRAVKTHATSGVFGP